MAVHQRHPGGTLAAAKSRRKSRTAMCLSRVARQARVRQPLDQARCFCASSRCAEIGPALRSLSRAPSSALSADTKMLAIGTFKAKGDADPMKPLLPAEVRAPYGSISLGKSTRGNLKADQSGVVFIDERHDQQGSSGTAGGRFPAVGRG